MLKIVIFHDYFITQGGAELFLIKLYKGLKKQAKRNKIDVYSLFVKKQVLRSLELLDIVNVKRILPKLLEKILNPVFKKSIGKLLTPFLNVAFSKRIKILSKKNAVLVNTSFFLPIKVKNITIYYHKFPTWFKAFPSSYLQGMPYIFRWIYVLFLNSYLELVFATFAQDSIRLISNSTKTAYLFYKYWQKHSYIFFPLILYEDVKHEISKVPKSVEKDNSKKLLKILYAGRLDISKKIYCILKTLESYPDIHRFFKFHIVGTGPLQPQVLKLANRSKILYKPWLKHDTLMKLMKKIDFVISLGDESFGLLLFEGVINRKGIIASLFSGAYDFAKLGRNLFTLYNERNMCSENLYNTLMSIIGGLKNFEKNKSDDYLAEFMTYYNLNRLIKYVFKT